MDTHPQSALGEPERRGPAGDARADDRDVDPAVVAGVSARWCGIFEPERVQEVGR
jgi:hypothetical protein